MTVPEKVCYRVVGSLSMNLPRVKPLLSAEKSARSQYQPSAQQILFLEVCLLLGKRVTEAANRKNRQHFQTCIRDTFLFTIAETFFRAS